LALKLNAQIKVSSTSLTSIGLITNPDLYFNLHVGNGYSQTKLLLGGGQDGANYVLAIYSAGCGSGFNDGNITANSSKDFKLCILNQGTAQGSDKLGA
jgi:hypothetical protein